MEEIEGEEGGGSDGLSSGRRQAARHVERGEIGGPGRGTRRERGGELRQDPGTAGADYGR
jgi:hypothetical protein